jgi:hypothetical protein
MAQAGQALGWPLARRIAARHDAWGGPQVRHAVSMAGSTGLRI